MMSNNDLNKLAENLSKAFDEFSEDINGTYEHLEENKPIVVGCGPVGSASIPFHKESVLMADPDFAKEELNKTIEEHKSLDIPIYKGPTGKERRRARRKGKKSRFKVGTKAPDSKSSKFVCRSVNHLSKFRA